MLIFKYRTEIPWLLLMICVLSQSLSLCDLQSKRGQSVSAHQSEIYTFLLQTSSSSMESIYLPFYASFGVI